MTRRTRTSLAVMTAALAVPVVPALAEGGVTPTALLTRAR
jgi:hypothetical protein